ncbi:glycosyltransferase [Haladaptatus sp. R4]|uniref:glycosyltransferase n=1 Tax=Haladaptatus sp. R4 TaxID=1679489 RepID=UPI001CBDA0AC|nr:glycosyltransferase [Haladaptatus sp. R4]
MVALSSLVVVVFAVSLLGLLHTYFLYPALLSLLAVRKSNSVRDDARSEWPSVTLVVAAYNEEDVIEEKIENSLKLEYPADKFRIVVFSDESSDRTDEIVVPTKTTASNCNGSKAELGKPSVRTRSPPTSSRISSCTPTRTACTNRTRSRT